MDRERLRAGPRVGRGLCWVEERLSRHVNCVLWMELRSWKPPGNTLGLHHGKGSGGLGHSGRCGERVQTPSSPHPIRNPPVAHPDGAVRLSRGSSTPPHPGRMGIFTGPSLSSSDV